MAVCKTWCYVLSTGKMVVHGFQWSIVLLCLWSIQDKLLDNLIPLIKTEVRQEHCLMLVYRQDGITKLTTVNLIARTPELAQVLNM